VNLGFVLNVIEDPIERADVLAEAWSLATRLLVVSVMIRGSGTREGAPFQDGIITSRQTFQRYFGQQEFQQYLEEGLHCSAIPIALGVFYVFRNPEEHQSFLQRRSRRTIAWEPFSGPPEEARRSKSERKPRVSERPVRVDRYEEHRDLLESFWSTVATLGRIPEAFEFARHGAIREHFGSCAKALRLLLRNGRAEVYESIRSARRGDLVVYLACANLRNKVPFSQLPATVQVDIREMFGTYARGLDEGLRMLFTAGDSTNVVLACDDANVGWQDSGALYCHSRLVAELPPLLRVYVGCAELLYGDARQADIVKIHKTSGKISFFSYGDFDRALLPELVLRTKVNLRTQCVDVYDHLGQGQLLYFKERFLTHDDPQYCALSSLGEELRRLGISDTEMIGPTMIELAAILTSARRDDLVTLLRRHTNSEHPDD
jgi:DNA phosphorothioation-associated putative methyltransferase